MTYCPKCNAQLPDGVAFCTACGAPTAAAQTPPPPPQGAPQPNGFADKMKNLTNTADETAAFHPADINENKVMAFLAYLGPLVFIPMFAKPESKYARFHSNQGLTLFIVDAAYIVAHIILSAILRMIFPLSWEGFLSYGRGPIYGILSFIISIPWFLIGILAILGIVNALTGKAKALPLIGKFKFLK